MTVTLGRPAASTPRDVDPQESAASPGSASVSTATASAASVSHRVPHLAGLDGIRALAVAAVVAYHAGATWLPGGFLGVDLFFVLSGFLITTLIAREVSATGAFGVRAFYRRRLARLVPALWTMIGVVAVVGLIWREQLDQLRWSIVAGLTSTSNWWQIAVEESYFSSGGRPPLLRHLWSLALEAQFYLLAPLLAWVLLRWGRRRLSALAVGLALASTALMAVWATVGEMPIPFDPSRLYFGTDTHLGGLMVGVAVGCLWQPWRTRSDSDGSTAGAGAASGERPATGARRSGLLADVVGVAALGVVVVLLATTGELSAPLYRGGFLAFSIAAVLLVAAAAHPGSVLGRLLAVPPLAWLGTRSYGIYLWHWPVFAFTRPGVDVPGPDWLVTVLRVALVLGIAELSYRYVETPARRGGLGRWVAGLRAPGRPGRLLVATGAATVILGLGTAVALVPAATSDVELGSQSVADQVERLPSAPSDASARGTTAPGTTAPGTTSPDGAARDTAAPDAAAAGTAEPDPTPRAPAPTPQAPTPSAPAPSAAATAPPGEPTPPVPAPAPTEELGSVTAIGDSVLAMAAPDLGALGVGVDAVKSRQFREMVDIALAARDAGTLGHTVIVHGGTNGPIAEADLRRLLDGTGERRVFLVNVKAPVAWEGLNNELLSRVVADYPRARVIDWAGPGAAHPEWFYSDTIHPREGEGSGAMAQLLWSSVQPG